MTNALTGKNMANAVLLLASENSNFIAGEIMDVDGGLMMDNLFLGG